VEFYFTYQRRGGTCYINGQVRTASRSESTGTETGKGLRTAAASETMAERGP